MRVFVALEVPGNVLDALIGFQQEASTTGADLKLVERENLHFTLKFLGEVSDATATEAKSRLERLALKGGEVDVRGAGAFPSPTRPRVVWAGVARDDEEIVGDIANAVITSLDGIGEREERPFRAHITLGRVRSDRNSSQLGELLRMNANKEFGVAKLSEFKLKSSVLTPRGPVYSDLGAYHLD